MKGERNVMRYDTRAIPPEYITPAEASRQFLAEDYSDSAESARERMLSRMNRKTESDSSTAARDKMLQRQQENEAEHAKS